MASLVTTPIRTTIYEASVYRRELDAWAACLKTSGEDSSTLLERYDHTVRPDTATLYETIQVCRRTGHNTTCHFEHRRLLPVHAEQRRAEQRNT